MLAGVAAVLALVPAAAARAGLADDPRDHAAVSLVLSRVLETERTKITIPWSNADTGNRGTIVIDRTFYPAGGQPCREYHRTVERAGEPVTVISGTGCRTGPAVWQIDERLISPSPPGPAEATPSPGDPAPSPVSGAATAPPPADPGAAPAEPRPPVRAEASRRSHGATAPAAKPDPAPAPSSQPTKAAPKMPDYTLPSKTPL